ncbi:LpqB [Leucobacter sp. 7(1)]|uniref:GerMN domain-containing protein n=1 Tax=Leucobacter sp. 7(1) TaxID=1255613 RepID=UPI00097E9D3E|nr:GerMN domain-containing protein [Leucobacter sp. 7(1)]SJN08242.1 LpqB [Leucobacter sp. 7(1)]
MIRERKTRRGRVLGALLASGVMLAGCSAIPTSGPVQGGLKDLQQVDQVYQYKPSGPIAGASQEDLVRGFVLAATSSVDDYATAREFLTSEYSSQWDPYYGVLIDEGTRPYRADSDTAGVLSLATTAKLDSAGDMLPVAPGPSMEMRFEFERVAGEWRISSAPSGIILDANTFSTIWSSHQLYFVGAGNLLVPETRWFLTRTALVTEIVGALLEGPGERMREVVRSGFPVGTSLASNSVPVVDGKARIDLTNTVLEASPAAMGEIRQQLKTSLQTVPGVTGFELSVEGTPLRPTPDEEINAPRPVTTTQAPAVMIGEEFGTVVSGEFTPWQGLGASLHDFDPEAITLSADEQAAALLGDSGVTRVDANGAILVDGRAGLLEPSIDPLGYVWTVPRADSDTLLATAPDGTATEVATPWLAGRSPAAVRLSPDGSRVAALVADGDESHVLVSGVIRDENGVPLRTVADADTKLWAAGTPRDLDWVGQLSFAALTGVGAAGKVTVGGVGLFGIERTSVPGGVHVSGGGGRSALRVLGADGDLFSPQGAGWQRSEDEIDVLAKRG